ncbi:50S ribosomal protein L13 [Candidatus Pacearchaeota archaeon]|nr:50S ribosomal protein L13 [Candidatus Pacearchaeota archaeon]
MSKIIDGRNAVLGRLASYAAKEALKGGEVAIVNCDKVIVTGRKNMIKEQFKEMRRRVGSGQLGPKVSRLPHMLVKRAIRGMLPNARQSGRGRDALARIKCHDGVPKEFEEKKKITFEENRGTNFITMEEAYK